VTALTFRALDDIAYGRSEQVSPLIRRVVADNPSKFTYKGTGTYIVGHGDVVVIDPGPLLDSHRDALAAALSGEHVRAILVTHCHADHSPLSAWLRAESGAPTFAYGPHPLPDPEWEELGRDGSDDSGDSNDGDDRGDTGAPVTEESTDFEFAPTHAVADGETVVDLPGVTISAVFTPGHTSNHICWALAEERALFTGDHIMGWSTTVVSPPDGDMTGYIDSLRKVAGRADAVLWPTHGPPRDDAASYVPALVEHRLARERGVLDAVRSGRSTVPDIVELLYADVRRELHKAAGHSVWGHLIKLSGEGRVTTDGGSRPGIRSTYRAV
jgi:glyoxylase-like metal-dependent hydrolase (beta-lactamase superfamily II)